MIRAAAFVAAITGVVLSSAHADYLVTDRGTWPESWPEELESLREQSRTAVGSEILREHHDIPFANREEFGAAWPHLLKVKSTGAPIILVRGPDTWLGDAIEAGVRVHAPPTQEGRRIRAEEPLPGERPVRHRWMWTTYIELIIDGEIVDLNRIPLPADTPIVDERFEIRPNEAGR